MATLPFGPQTQASMESTLLHLSVTGALPVGGALMEDGALLAGGALPAGEALPADGAVLAGGEVTACGALPAGGAVPAGGALLVGEAPRPAHSVSPHTLRPHSPDWPERGTWMVQPTAVPTECMLGVAPSSVLSDCWTVSASCCEPQQE